MPKGGKKKPFISKDSAVHFSVIHRSQRDPLIHDETKPRFVLQEVSRLNKGKGTKVRLNSLVISPPSPRPHTLFHSHACPAHPERIQTEAR